MMERATILASTTFRRMLGISSALGLLMAPVAASAASWTPEGSRHFVEVAHKLAAAANTGTDEMGAACKGISMMGTGEIHHEATQSPSWAVRAHAITCFAYSSMASREHGHGFMKSTNPCKNLKSAIDELGSAKPGSDPEEVVAAAGQLSVTLQSLAGDMKDAKSCKFAKRGLF